MHHSFVTTLLAAGTSTFRPMKSCYNSTLREQPAGKTTAVFPRSLFVCVGGGGALYCHVCFKYK